MLRSRKAQSQLVTHSVLILFAVALLVAVVTSMNKIEEQYQDFTNNMSTKEICSMLKSSAERIYQPVSENIVVNKTSVMGYSILSLPTKLGNDYYSVKFSGNDITIETSKISYSCKIGINTTFSGISYGGKTRLSWLYGGGTNSITIENA